MNVRNIGVLRLVAVVFGLVLWLPVSRFLASSRDYREAEPLVEVIWPMAYAMKRFSEESGRPPASLDEISRFSPDDDFSALRRYPHEFSTTGPRRFFLRVNHRFAFVLGEHYAPMWWQPTPTSETVIWKAADGKIEKTKLEKQAGRVG